MANVVPFSFAQELLKGTHNFTSNTIKLALYTANPYTHLALSIPQVQLIKLELLELVIRLVEILWSIQ